MKDKKTLEKMIMLRDYFFYYTIVAILFMAFSIAILLPNFEFVIGLHSTIFNVPELLISQYIYISIGIAKFIIFFVGLFPAIALHILIKRFK